MVGLYTFVYFSHPEPDYCFLWKPTKDTPIVKHLWDFPPNFDLSYSAVYEGSGNNSGILWHNWKHSLAFTLQVVGSQWNNKWACEPLLTATQGQILVSDK